jgi:Flp pilus assembly pilin Flp
MVLRVPRIGARQKAQEVVEYGLLMATIVLLVLIGLPMFGSTLQAWFNGLAARIATTGI